MISASNTARRPAAKKAKAPSGARQARNQALADLRRELVLDAARSAFFELGMEKTSIREIAQRAGYTPGAIYSYFASKEEMYGALLAESLDRLNEHVQAALAKGPTGAERLRAAAGAFFDFYLANPRDLDLGFYLFQGMKPRGLTPELNDMLNSRLLQALQPTQAELEALGMPSKVALQEVTALFAHIVGILVMSHTGRIRMFKQASVDLFSTYLSQLVDRAARKAKAPK
ncbi:TetR/AcrR family transcriptional regulator [Diaphorobacter sp. ED-3]|jgi:AcrR family transcriptional regulator|uniref:TetR/AcrR family transcriptional regulator n=1 Tax=Diaphorobacter sp. ED-3 TaxID=3016636 RepID=UPI0022DD5774|nr:TetR/AcrR family transcriptional regulator [Diaphorobacter sp. ED-3]